MVLDPALIAARDAQEGWWKAQPNLEALDSVVALHFQRRHPPASSQHIKRELLNQGCYALVYLYTLHTATHPGMIDAVVAKVVLPWRPRYKTDGEVATMRFIHSQTNIRVPEVYKHCSDLPNDVGMEWILMEYVPGERGADVYPELGRKEKRHLIQQLARIVARLFMIKATEIGTLLPVGASYVPSRNRTLYKDGDDVSWWIGPLNDLAYEDLWLIRSIPADRCGPFKNTRELFEAFALLGKPPLRAPINHAPGNKFLELYDLVIDRPRDTETFCFSHGDLALRNILITRDGDITAVLDWANAGFRPPSLAATAPDFFEDDEKLSGTPDSDQTTPEALKILREEGEEYFIALYRTLLHEANPSLYASHVHGAEQRQMYHSLQRSSSPGNLVMWMWKYGEVFRERSEERSKARREFSAGLPDWFYERQCELGQHKHEEWEM
ncbi:kinase-like protein [Dacryopinax primogenitus]|uniref:Kinase-like protein n=1 Tax=Dacryopinax primogenitus (strain DJM 731) TaxID=1858805 RepID=M5FNA3_DACPD|nr:kinase-like protein [Dacryopinax primogenitus]EJT97095.1 kinase-like protein [Dacryopinax primogenitus]